MTSCLNYTFFTKIITVAINIGDLSRYCSVMSCAVHLSISNEKNLLMEKVGNIFQVSGRKAGVSHSLWQRGGHPGQAVHCQPLLKKKIKANSVLLQSEVLIVQKGIFVCYSFTPLVDIFTLTPFCFCVYWSTIVNTSIFHKLISIVIRTVQAGLLHTSYTTNSPTHLLGYMHNALYSSAHCT